MKTEIWKDIKGYKGIYLVSNLGRVKSLKFGRERMLKAGIGKGYLKVVLQDGKPKSRTIHSLVAEAFLNHTICGMKLVVNHINLNKLDNRVENLEVITQRENANKKHIKNSSEYTGVHWDKKRSKWIAQITIKGKSKHLGTFTNEIEASEKYQEVLMEVVSSVILE